MCEHSSERRGLPQAILALGLAAGTLGCGGEEGPPLVDVYGTVTMDGGPVPDATVRFVPERQGSQSAEHVRPATGRTDDDGDYLLEYSTSRSGALPGKYKVSITTFREPDVDLEGNDVPGAPETVPDLYNVKTTLTAEVKEGGGPWDFQLDSSKGEIPQTRGGEDFGAEDADY